LIEALECSMWSNMSQVKQTKLEKPKPESQPQTQTVEEKTG